MSAAARPGLARRLALGLLSALATLLILLDELVRPLYRPLARRVAALRLVQRIEGWIATLPRFAVLILLAIPFAIAEPLKLVGLVMIGHGRVMGGLLVMALAYLASILIVERIFRAGEAQLLSYGWLARAIGWLGRLRRLTLDWVRRQPLYLAARAGAAAARERLRRLWLRLPSG